MKIVCLLAFFSVVSMAQTPGTMDPGRMDPGTKDPGTNDAAGEGVAIFRSTVAPVLKQKCAGCHGKGQQISGFSAANRELLLKGGHRGAGLVPGDSKSSLLVAVMDQSHQVKMPPSGKLPDATLAAFRRWIDLGAPWDDSSPTNGPAVEKPQSETESDTWAFQKIAKPKVSGDPTHVIDQWIQQRLQKAGLTAAAKADRRTLIRRAYFDLWGLPPTHAEIDEFVQDRDPQSWPKLIDRLLASPRYGERWGRHWLDVVRYADTAGFSNDFERPNAWRYRDYVIRAFNTDRPLRDFIRQQIAGDELDPTNPENVIATGFLRMGPWEHTAMSVAAVTRQEWLDDVTHITAAAFLGVTLECARCHDHKFDPIPTKDYYRIQAAFATTQFDQRNAAFLPQEPVQSFSLGQAEFQREAEQNRAKIAEFDALVKQRVLQANPSADVDEIKQAVKTKKLLTPTEFENYKVYQKREELNRNAQTRFQPVAYSVKKGELAETFILPIGNLQTPGEKVSPGVMQAAYVSNPHAVPESIEGRRLALANWIADPTNPLPARVMVNRIWHYHFGKGIVATPNDFGKMGKRPTHPELLDYLAAIYLENGGQIKPLHRWIMNSEAYQRSSDPVSVAETDKLDPDRILLGHFLPRRLESEAIRDSLLHVAGELSLRMGGPGSLPEINRDIAEQPVQIMGTMMPVYRPAKSKEDRHRRTIYTFQKRNLQDPMLEVFNGPSLAESTAKRDATTIPTQAYALVNGQLVHDMAAAVAIKTATSADPIVEIYQRILGRKPSAAERQLMSQHVSAQEIAYRTLPLPVAKQKTKLRRSITSELTGAEVFVEENLDDAGEPNVQSEALTPKVRALADVALVLLNSNEFIYVY
jgi:hypothetical protein